MIQNLTDEQQAFVEAIRDFAQRECGSREQRAALTDHGQSPHNDELYRRVAQLGWLGATIPVQYGGSGGGAVDMCLLFEERPRADPDGVLRREHDHRRALWSASEARR